MHPKKKGPNQGKNFGIFNRLTEPGPIKKLAVPDFQQITDFYKGMQQDIMDNPQMAK